MKFKLDHIAVAVRDLDKARAGFEEKLGLSCEHVEEVPTEKARVAFFDVGGPHIELVSPTEAGSAMESSRTPSDASPFSNVFIWIATMCAAKHAVNSSPGGSERATAMPGGYA